MARLRARIITELCSAPWVLLLILVALSGCSVRLIQPYDEVIEQTVTEFHEEFLRFTTTMGRTRGTFAENSGFYDKWQPKLKTLTARAIAANPGGKCPGTETYGGLLLPGGAARTVPPSTGGRADAAPPGDCMAQLLQLLEDQLEDFAKFHEAQGALGLPAGARAPRDLVLTSVRAVLYVELTRKQGK